MYGLATTDMEHHILIISIWWLYIKTEEWYCSLCKETNVTVSYIKFGIRHCFCANIKKIDIMCLIPKLWKLGPFQVGPLFPVSITTNSPEQKFLGCWFSFTLSARKSYSIGKFHFPMSLLFCYWSSPDVCKCHTFCLWEPLHGCLSCRCCPPKDTNYQMNWKVAWLSGLGFCLKIRRLCVWISFYKLQSTQLSIFLSWVMSTSRQHDTLPWYQGPPSMGWYNLQSRISILTTFFTSYVFLNLYLCTYFIFLLLLLVLCYFINPFFNYIGYIRS